VNEPRGRLGGNPAPARREGRTKTAAEYDIERRWREVLSAGGTAGDFQRAYDELHSEFLSHEGKDAQIYDHVNPRDATDDRVRSVVLRRIGSGQRVLEVGTGDGQTAYMLARQGNDVLSVDVSKLALERARAMWLDDSDQSLDFAFGDARQLDVASESMDWVVSENMVEHITVDDMRRHLTQVRRVLRDGGSYLLYTPSRLWSGRVSAGFHLHVYTLRELCALLRAHGLFPLWLEPRVLHCVGRLVPLAGPGLWPVFAYEWVLQALRVHRWPVSIRSRVIPSIMIQARATGNRSAAR